MELAGDEKRIQALFSEASIHDRSAAPTFEEVWSTAAAKHGAATRRSTAAGNFRKPLFAFTVTLLIAGAAWGAWSWYRSTRATRQQAVNVTPQPVSTPALQLAQQQNNPGVSIRSHAAARSKKPARKPQRSATSELAQLSSWESPTQLLMKSPAAVDLSSLPQLNQSVEQLKRFLPRNAELTKESNQ